MIYVKDAILAIKKANFVVKVNHVWPDEYINDMQKFYNGLIEAQSKALLELDKQQVNESDQTIRVLSEHLNHWKRLQNEKICDEKEGEDTIRALEAAIAAIQRNGEKLI